VGQELDQFEMVVFATSATFRDKPTKQKLTLVVSDPDEETIFEEKISIGAKKKELEHKVEKRGVYQMCYEIQDLHGNFCCSPHLYYSVYFLTD
jgi:hypothetical protein